MKRLYRNLRNDTKMRISQKLRGRSFSDSHKQAISDAMKAYLKQRAIAQCSRAKLNIVWDIMRENRSERIIIFTADNDTAYRMGEIFCMPVLTHKTKAAERKDFLDRFRSGEYIFSTVSAAENIRSC